MSTYTARAQRTDDRFWFIHVPEINQYTQARTVPEIETMARDLVAVWLEVPLEEVEVSVEIALPDQVQARLDHAAELREQEAKLRREAADDVRSAAVALKGAGISLRDIGKLLGVSFQRAGQLVGGR